jgi:hypothetical protein
MQPLDIFNSSSPLYYTYGVSVCSTITGKYSLNTHTHPSLFCWCPQFVVSITNRAYVYHWEIDLLYNFFSPLRMCFNCLTVLIIICLETFDVALPNGYNKIKKRLLPNQICLSTLIWGYCRFYSAFYICKQVVYTVWCSRIALSLFFVCASFYMKTFSWIFVFITIISLFFLQPFPEFFGTES